MTIKKYFLIVAVLAAAGLVLNLIFSKPTASLLLDYGNGEVRKFNGEVIEYMTVLDALVAASNGDDFKIEYPRDNLDLRSILIDGKNKVEIKLNGNAVPVSMISRTMIGHEDLIEVKLRE